MNEPCRIEELLKQYSNGSNSALDELLDYLAPDIREAARRVMAKEIPGHTLQTTALINEAYMRLRDQEKMILKNKPHFLAALARLFRRILVDHARKKNAQKRGGGKQRVLWADAVDQQPSLTVDILDLEEKLKELEMLDARQFRIVEMKFYAEMSDQQIASVLEISERTIRNEWMHARAWLFGRLRLTSE